MTPRTKVKSLAYYVRLIETIVIRDALLKTGWNKSRTARLLKISRASLHDKIKKYGLDVENYAQGLSSTSLEDLLLYGEGPLE